MFARSLPWLGLSLWAAVLAAHADDATLKTLPSARQPDANARAALLSRRPVIGACDLKLVSAETNVGNAKNFNRYTFEGHCPGIKITPPDRQIAINKPDYNVRIQAEWYGKMKRASESVRVLNGDVLGSVPGAEAPFSTWATCDEDPFRKKGVACHGQGASGNEVVTVADLALVPLAQGQTNLDQVAASGDTAGTLLTWMSPTPNQIYTGGNVLYLAKHFGSPVAPGWVCCEIEKARIVNGSWENEPISVWADLASGHSKAYGDFTFKGPKRIRARMYQSNGNKGPWTDWLPYTVMELAAVGRR